VSATKRLLYDGLALELPLNDVLHDKSQSFDSIRRQARYAGLVRQTGFFNDQKRGIAFQITGLGCSARAFRNVARFVESMRAVPVSTNVGSGAVGAVAQSLNS